MSETINFQASEKPYSWCEDIKNAVSLPFVWIALQIIKMVGCIFDCRATSKKLSFRLTHHSTALAHRTELTSELRGLLIARTRNLPKITFNEAKAKEEAKRFLELQKTAFTKDFSYYLDSTDSTDKKVKEEIERNFTLLESKVKNNAIEINGNCHSICTKVAHTLLNTTFDRKNLMKAVLAFQEGADEVTAGLQYFMDSHDNITLWDNVEAAYSVLNLHGKPLNEDLFTSQTLRGIFQVSIDMSFCQHTLLLIHGENGNSYILDPNFGLFEFQTAQTKEVFCKLLKAAYYKDPALEAIKDRFQKEVVKEINCIIPSTPKSYWALGYKNKLRKCKWEMPFKFTPEVS